jgi:hypothetical protein
MSWAVECQIFVSSQWNDALTLRVRSHTKYSRSRPQLAIQIHSVGDTEYSHFMGVAWAVLEHEGEQLVHVVVTALHGSITNS